MVERALLDLGCQVVLGGVMGKCWRCSQPTGLFREHLCGHCKPVVDALGRFQHWFRYHARDGILSPDEWHHLRQVVFAERLDFTEAMRFVQQDALVLLDRTFASISADGVITEEQRKYFNELRHALGIPEHLVHHLTQRLEYLAALSNVRLGKLPTIQPRRIVLEAGEICHLDVDASHYRRMSRKTVEVQGRLVATSKKLYWLSQEGGTDARWSHVAAVERSGGLVLLSLTKKSLTGAYAVPDPWWTEAVLDTIARIDKRQILAAQDAKSTRRIPQEVKTAVWQRDQGRCVQCQASGLGVSLEFDHIIPFAHGGANSVENIQILCRPCNLKKRDRI